MRSKLVIIEGIPGSGKTTVAKYVRDWLVRHGARPALYIEGDLDHPADFESVACLDEGEYARLVAQFPAYKGLLDRQAVRKGGEWFFGYRKLQLEFGDQLPEELIQALARYEIYELPISKFHRLTVARWQAFTKSAIQSDKVLVFECCFLQNPLTMYLGHHDEDFETAVAHILEIAGIVRRLDPVLIYLHPGEAGKTLRRVAQVRPREWLDFVIAYHTQQGHGKAQGWQGFDGMIKFYEMRQALELDILPRLPFQSLLVPHRDWDQDHNRIATFLEEVMPG